MFSSSVMVSLSTNGHFHKHCITEMGVATIPQYTIQHDTLLCPAYRSHAIKVFVTIGRMFLSDIQYVVAVISTLFIPYSDKFSQ